MLIMYSTRIPLTTTTAKNNRGGPSSAGCLRRPYDYGIDRTLPGASTARSHVYGAEWDTFCNDLEMTLCTLNKYRKALKILTILFWLTLIMSIVAIAFNYNIETAGWTKREGLIFVTLVVPALVGIAMLITAWYIHRRLYRQTWIQVRLLAENFTVVAKDSHEDDGDDEEYGRIQQHNVSLLLCDDQSGEASKVYNGKQSTSFFSVWSLEHNLYLQLSISPPSHTAIHNDFNKFPILPMTSIQISSALQQNDENGSTFDETSRFSSPWSVAAESIYTSSNDNRKKTGRRADDNDDNGSEIDVASLASVNFIITQSREGKSTNELSAMYAHSPWHEDKTKYEEEKNQHQEHDDDIERELYESNLVESMEKSKTTSSTTKKSNKTTNGKKHHKKHKKTTTSTNKTHKKHHKKHGAKHSAIQSTIKMIAITEEDDEDEHNLEEKNISMESTFPLSSSLPSVQSQSPKVTKKTIKTKKNSKESKHKKTKKEGSSSDSISDGTASTAPTFDSYENSTTNGSEEEENELYDIDI